MICTKKLLHICNNCYIYVLIPFKRRREERRGKTTYLVIYHFDISTQKFPGIKKEKVPPHPLQKKEIFIKPPRQFFSMRFLNFLRKKKPVGSDIHDETTASSDNYNNENDANSVPAAEKPSSNRVATENIRANRGTTEYERANRETTEDHRERAEKLREIRGSTENRLLQKSKPLFNKDFNYGVMYGAFKTEFDEVKKKIEEMHQNLANNQSLILGKTDELSEDHRGILGQLGENRKKLGLLVEKAEQYSAQPSIPTELTEDLKRKVNEATLSLRQAEIYEIIKQSDQVTPKEIADRLKIAENTASEHLRNLEKLGFLVRVNRGLYRINNEPNRSPSTPLPASSPAESESQTEV